MNPFDRDFLSTLLDDGSEPSVEDLVSLVPDRDLEKIAFLTPKAMVGVRRAVGSGMQGLTATAPVKTLGGVGGALYGGMQDPGYDPMTGQQNSRLANAALYGIGGLAAGAGLQGGARAALGMQGKTGDYLRKAQTMAARNTTNLADRKASIAQLKAGYKEVGQAMPRISEKPGAGLGKKFDMAAYANKYPNQPAAAGASQAAQAVTPPAPTLTTTPPAPVLTTTPPAAAAAPVAPAPAPILTTTPPAAVGPVTPAAAATRAPAGGRGKKKGRR